ncbi:hypothetical protein [Orbus mooreae]|uniref:hypothetical protein n=1 Tax=Orbus mooreae TaxID=3074107 RepID=UPI00370D0E94
MVNKNDNLICDIEAKLYQIGSMARIALENHNYKNSGYSEPFIDSVDMGNLMWAIADLASEAISKLNNIEVKEDVNHA